MNEKDIPDKFMNQECLNMLMLIQFPSIAKQIKFPKQAGGHDAKVSCFEVFRENSSVKRL